MRRWLPIITFSLLTAACAPFACGNGAMGEYRLFPWTFRTHYAYMDKKTTRQTAGRTEYISRPDDAGGEQLVVRLFGFMFNPVSDRRTWTSQEWQHYINGLTTQPSITIFIARANKMDNGDDIEFDTENPPSASLSDPLLQVTFTPGHAGINNRSEYPDEKLVYGTRRNAKVTLQRIADEPGPMGFVQGTLEYTIERDDGDPDDALEGEITVNFNAQVLGERLAECNESTTPFGGGDACEDYE